MRIPYRNEPVITIIGDGIDLGEALETRTRRSLSRMIRKYLGHLIAANVYFNRDGLLFQSTVNLQIGSLGFVTSEAFHENAYQAFQASLMKSEKQLRRLKRRLRDGKRVLLQRAIARQARAIRHRNAAAVSQHSHLNAA